MSRSSLAERAYAALLVLYPPAFRRRFGREIVELFADRLRDARGEGSRAVIALWWRTVADVIATAVHEWVAAARRPTHLTSIASTPGDGMLITFARDVRFAGRMLRKSPVFTAVAVLVVALGVGSVSTIFSVANAIVLRPIPGVADQDGLVTVTRIAHTDRNSMSASYPYYRALAEGSHQLRVAAWSMVPLTVSTGDVGTAVSGNIVSGNYFDVLGIRPVLGRFFTDEESSVPRAHPVVVIAHGFWQRRFGGDPAIVGRSILVNGAPFTVVGVAPPGFSGLFPVMRIDAWVPLMMQQQVRRGGDLLSQAGAGWLLLVARVQPDVSRVRAEAEATTVTRRIAESAGEPPFMKPYDAVELSPVTSLPSDVAGPVAGFFAVLLVIAGLVLLIASVNVASMLLARGIARRRDIAVRVALGASRARLVRQLLTESALLFGLGGSAGVLLAVVGTRLMTRIELPADVPLALDVAPDAWVVTVTLGVALVTGIVFGLAPALRASRTDLAQSMRGDSAGAGRSRSQLRNVLVAGQVAVSLLLLSAAGLFARALDRAHRVDPGFDVSHAATATLDVGSAGYDDPRAREFYRVLGERLAAMPGVEAVGYARHLPLSASTSGIDVVIDGYTPPAASDGGTIVVHDDVVDEGYFAAMRIPVLRGRAFRATDDERAPKVAIVNEEFVRRYWPTGEAVGRTVRSGADVITIVGVVPTTKYGSLSEKAQPFLYLSMAQYWRNAASLVVRSRSGLALLAPEIGRAMHAIDPHLPPPAVTTLAQAIAIVLLPQRVAAAVTGVLGLAGLLLAVVGLYGILSFSAAQRAREIGVRVALGASRRAVLRLVIGEGMRLVSIGMAVGLVLALLATRALAPFLFGVSPVDALTFVTIAITLGAAALVACWLPARRAAGVDPVVTLRQE